VAAADRLSLVQSCSFSGCVSTQFTALLNGASLYPFDLQALGPCELGQWMRQERLTMFHAVPALFRALADAVGSLPDVRTVRLEGDKAAWSDVAIFRRTCPAGSVLINGLGTTETGLVRRFVVDHSLRLGTGPLPLGDAVDGVEIRLLDSDGQPVAAGEVGEIAVQSAYLAVGYWRQPSLTAAAFRRADDAPETRVYRTGDLGRFDAEGCLEYHGRRDHQAKIRGERVGTVAVERALLALGFPQTVVVTREDDGEEPRLVAYVASSPSSPRELFAVRSALSRDLPPAWFPSGLVVLAVLPLI
jgi:non-ribosomal peptide synthetase component F